MEKCKTEKPILIEEDARHFVACHYVRDGG
jgi:hypothetical protein